MAELENIDDECDQNDIAFVKIDNDAEAKEYGIDTLPVLIYFEKRIPYIYEGWFGTLLFLWYSLIEKSALIKENSSIPLIWHSMVQNAP